MGPKSSSPSGSGTRLGSPLVKSCIQLGATQEAKRRRMIPSHRASGLTWQSGGENSMQHLISDQPKRSRALRHDGQYGCRRRRSCIDAVAVLINHTQRAWKWKNVDVKFCLQQCQPRTPHRTDAPAAGQTRPCQVNNGLQPQGVGRRTTYGHTTRLVGISHPLHNLPLGIVRPRGIEVPASRPSFFCTTWRG